jgi:abhydrolase domain-containing protein 6
MAGTIRAWLDRLRADAYCRRPPLILVNGLAEQAETWFRNRHFWTRHFEVHLPNILAYDGAALHRRIADDLPIDVDYLVEQLHLYLEEFVQTPPYHLVASSLGGKVVVEYAVRYPENVGRLVLLCPSGMGDAEQLPVIEGMRRSDLGALIGSVFHDPRKADRGLFPYYHRQFGNRRWRLGLLRTIRGTMSYTVRDRLHLVCQPTLFIAGREDRIVDSVTAAAAAAELPCGQFRLIPHCGHAPHIEIPGTINRMVVRFLMRPQPAQTRDRQPVSPRTAVRGL